jgi:hypothetical protein
MGCRRSVRQEKKLIKGCNLRKRAQILLNIRMLTNPNIHVNKRREKYVVGKNKNHVL